MSEEKILEILQPIFNRILRLEADEFNEDMSMLNTSKWDSLSNIRLILEIEEAFDVHFSTENIENIKSVRDLVNLLS